MIIKVGDEITLADGRVQVIVGVRTVRGELFALIGSSYSEWQSVALGFVTRRIVETESTESAPPISETDLPA